MKSGQDKQLLTVLDSMDYAVYVADMETFELLFVNRYIQNIWGDITGQICWQTLQPGQKGPCVFCTNDKLLDAEGRPTGLYKWDFYNKMTDTWYECRDSTLEWIDGRIVRMEIALDITERKQMEEALNFQLKVEKVISKISATFFNLPSEKIDEGINHTLQLTGDLFDSDRTYLFLLSSDGEEMSNTHEWCNQGVEPQLKTLQNLPTQTFPWWMERLGRFEFIPVQHVDNLPPEAAAEKEILQAQSIKSVLVVPVVWDNKLHGFMGFDSIRYEKTWINEHISLLRVVSELISTALLKREADETLRESEEKYRALAESIPDIIIRFDQKGRHLLVSQSAAQVVDIEPSLFIGKTHRELGFAEDMCAFWEDAIDTVFKQGQQLETEFEFEGINGPVVFNWRLVPEFDRSGNVKTVLSISRDITERKEAEKQIQENNLILARLNTIALEQAGVLNYERLIELVLKQIKESTGAILSVFNEYDAEKRVLITKKVQSEENIINIAIRLGGKKILNTVTPVDDAVHNRILSFVVNYHATLTQASEGTIPAAVSAAIQKLSGVQRFITLSHVTEGKLYGTTLIGLGKGQADASLEFLESFAHITAISLRRLQAEQKITDYTLELEQLYHQLDSELDKARQVHERTLPTALPDVEGISFAAHYQPAQKMGGDFYNVIHTGKKLVFYLSDVSGHGLDGAMLSVFIKQAIDSYVNLKPDDISPHKILQHLSRQFSRENYPEDLYFCIFMAVLDLDTLELSYCGAGFQQELLLRLGSSETLQLATKGMFITSYLPAEMLTLQDESIFITPGTTIFLTSDGLTEQGSKGAYYRDRLPGVFYENAHLPATLVAQAVVDDFRIFNNGSLQGKDDITFLVLQLAL